MAKWVSDADPRLRYHCLPSSARFPCPCSVGKNDRTNAVLRSVGSLCSLRSGTIGIVRVFDLVVMRRRARRIWFARGVQ